MSTGLPPGAYFMKGGFQVQIDDLFHKYEQPVILLLGFVMVITIIFVGKIPVEVRKQADTLIGRASLILFTVIIVLAFGWPYGFLAGLMSAVLIGAGGVHPTIRQINEGFTSEMKAKEGFSSEMNVRLVPSRQKWFVERVLGENPLIIEDETVETSAVQDLSEKSTGSVQSSSVTR